MYRQLTTNTILLLVRTCLTIIISLYITRIALELLGISSFGLYSVISSITSLMSFFSSSLSSATQRCVSYYLGKRSFRVVEEIISASTLIHILFATIVVVLAVSSGNYYIEYYLNVDAHRLDDAKFILNASIITIFVVISCSPAVATLLSFEKVKFYTFILMLEVIIRFILVISMFVLNIDDVRTYALVMSITMIIPSILATLYCKLSLKINYTINISRSNYFEIIFLTSWNSFGTLSYVLMTQGGSILINSFYGVALNAARGASLQVQSALLQVSNSAQAAINPKLVKLYSSGEGPEFSNLLLKSTKYIYLLLLLVSAPLYVNSYEVIQLWLKEPPELTSDFVKYIIIINLINTLSFGVMTGVQATGKVKYYQLTIGTILLLNLPISYVFMAFGHSVLVLLQVNLLLAVIALVCRFYFIKNILHLCVYQFSEKIIVPVVISTFFCIFLSEYLVSYIDGNTISDIISRVFLTFFVTAFSIFAFALSYREKKWLLKKINSIEII
jgi:O-antigen/teichoic acid export membrane protein